MDQLSAISKIAASGMQVQSERMRVITENIANAQSTGSTPGADPYRRKTITFEEVMSEGIAKVAIKDIGQDTRNFRLEYDPSHPAADADGFVKMSNVNPIAESADLREASNSYRAALNALDAGRQMKSQLLGLLK